MKDSESPLPPTEAEDPSTSVELVGFGPSLRQEGASKPSVVDAAALARKRWLRWSLVAAAVLIAGLSFYTGPDLYRSAKSWRAASLARKAEGEVAQNQMDEAMATVKTAYMMAPNDPEVLRATAQTLTALNAPSAMTYWNWFLDSKEATDQDRRAAVECALKQGLYNQAGTIIQNLLQRDSHSAPNLLMAARYYALAGAPDQALNFGTRATTSDPSYKPAAIFLAVQELDNSYLRSTGIDSLMKIADGNDAYAFLAVQRLAMESQLTTPQVDHLLALMQAHPPATEEQKITQLILQIRQHPENRDSLLDQAVAAHQNASPDDLQQFGAWLNSIHESARVLTLIPKNKALAKKDLFLVRLDALGSLKRWNDLQSLLTQNQVPLEKPYVELYLYRCSRELGDAEGADLHWRTAQVDASHSTSQSLYLAGYAENLGDNDRAESIYRSLTQDLMAGHAAYLGLLRIDATKSTKVMRDLLDEMAARWPQDEAIANDDVYYNLLLNDRVPEMYKEAVALAKADLASAPHLTDVALAYLRLNGPLHAMKVYENTHIQWSTASPSTLVVYAATLKANGHEQEAHDALANVKRDALRPEEQELIQSIP